MISPQEAIEKAEKWWNSQAFLQAWLRGEDFFEGGREIPQIGLVKSNEILSKLVQIIHEQEQLKAHSKKTKGFGYQLAWETINNRHSQNEFITKIYFDSAYDFLKFIKKEIEFEQFKINVQLIADTLPCLKSWTLKNPLKVIEHATKWCGLLKVCQYFIENPNPNLYIRQLSINNISTKFIEENRAIVTSLLNHILPESSINSTTRDFEKRFGLLESEPLVRFVILDEDLFINGLSDISLPISQFEALFIQEKIERVFLAENQMCILTFPKIPNSIIIFGGGKAVTNLSKISWLQSKPVYYWGDFDVEGFSILSSLREFKPDSVSLMMDWACFNLFVKENITKGENSVKNTPTKLSEQEVEVFEYLKNQSIDKCRLEQEKIPQWYVQAICDAL